MTHPAKRKGDLFERTIVDYLAEQLPAERIPASATIDRGDIWLPGTTLQCKNHVRLDLPAAWRDTQQQAGNNRHHDGWLIHKRHGVTDPAAQWVTCDLAQLRRHLERNM